MHFSLKIWHLLALILRSSTRRFCVQTQITQKSRTKKRTYFSDSGAYAPYAPCMATAWSMDVDCGRWYFMQSILYQIDDHLRTGKPARYVIRHAGQLSLATPPWLVISSRNRYSRWRVALPGLLQQGLKQLLIGCKTVWSVSLACGHPGRSFILRSIDARVACQVSSLVASEQLVSAGDVPADIEIDSNRFVVIKCQNVKRQKHLQAAPYVESSNRRRRRQKNC